MHPGPQTSRLEAIQVLRAVAAILVTQAHTLVIYQDRLELPRPWQVTAFGDFGCSGVDMFFVISGFIMAMAVDYRRPGQALFFLSRRAIRVAPSYWLASVLFITGMLLIGHDFADRRLLDSLTIFPTGASSSFHAPVLWVGWTLAFELAFYLVIALAMRISVNHSEGIRNSLFLVCILAFAGCIYQPENNLLAVFFNSIWFDFAFGIIAYLVWTTLPAYRSFSYGAVFASAGLVALGFSAVAGYPFIESPDYVMDHGVGLIRALWWGLPSALLMLGLLYMAHDAKPETFSNSLIWRLLLRIGDASYSLYLLHLGVVLTFVELMPANQINADLMMCSIVAFNIGLALAAYRWVEQPMLRWLNVRHPATSLNI